MVGKRFYFINLCRKVRYFLLEREKRENERVYPPPPPHTHTHLRFVKNVLCIMVKIYSGDTVDTLRDLVQDRLVLNRSNQSWFNIQLTTVNRWRFNISLRHTKRTGGLSYNPQHSEDRLLYLIKLSCTVCSFFTFSYFF